ncbi:metal-dependent hydrolase [Desulfocurvibacter africanus]|uniref:metal-dependent hydrolase n=1 Tax=Desulfocurvibacter africanus TaxID=873 RepID=UPI00040C8A63|nr:metal-dependent hydrolase [Desulfocurvibacter africanus]
MDPVTHLASGILAGQAVRDGFLPWKRIIPFCMLAAWIPDIDNLFSLLGPGPYLLYHRGITHSFVGGLAVALLLALAAKAFNRSLAAWRVAAVAYGCVLAHIFLDLITNYGTQIYLPFTHARASFPCVFIIDPFFTLTLLAFGTLSFMAKPKRRFFAVVGLAWLVIYPLSNATLRENVGSLYARKLASQGVPFDGVHVQPDAFSPLWWKIIVEQGDTYRVTSVSLLPGKGMDGFKTFRKADPALLDSLAAQSEFVDIYRWFSRFLAMEEQATEHGRLVIFRDLRFLVMTPAVQGLMGNGEAPFVLQVELDGQGRLMRAVFLQRGETVVFQAAN